MALLSDQDKSILLAKAAGWQMNDLTEPMDWRDENGDYLPMTITFTSPRPDLYNPSNMEAAWKIVNWVDSTQQPFGDAFDEFWTTFHLWVEPAETVLRMCLDEIFDLAVEYGVIQVEKNETGFENLVDTRAKAPGEYQQLFCTICGQGNEFYGLRYVECSKCGQQYYKIKGMHETWQRRM